MRYLRWGGDGEAVQPEKCLGVGNCLRLPQNPQRQVHALLARFFALRPITLFIVCTLDRRCGYDAIV